MATVFLTGDTQLTQPLVVDLPQKNIVITGKIESNSDISFKVNNLVVLGEVLSKAKISLKAGQDIFNFGSINAGDKLTVKAESIYNGVNTEAVEKVRALGVDITLAASNTLKVIHPTSVG